MNGNNQGKGHNTVFYHGTSTACDVKRRLLSPMHTLTLRESFRKKNLDVVFLTISLPSAIKYAKKACEKFGKEPVVYRTIPCGRVVMQGTECICDSAIIVGKVRWEKAS